jgi:hypothetical protein
MAKLLNHFRQMIDWHYYEAQATAECYALAMI